MKRITFGLIIVLMGLAFLSCTNPATDTTTAKFSKLAIIDAKTLFIAPAGSGSRTVTSVDKLFKITEDGYVQEVDYFDESGEVVSLITEPTAIYNVNEIYIIICFGSYEGYLIRKTDGSVYSLINVGIPHVQLQFGSFKNATKIQTDLNGNIYYQSTSTGEASTVKLIKINVADPSNLTAISYLPDTDIPSGFLVTAEGHVVYNYGTGFSNRIKKANGGLFNLPTGGWLTFWIGLDGKIHYMDQSDINNIKATTVNIDSSYNISTTFVAGVNVSSSVNCYQIRFPTRIILVETEISATVVGLPGIIKEIENPANVPRKITLSGIDLINNCGQSNTYYYLSGNDSSGTPVLVKVNPIDDSVSNLITPGLYDIYSMIVGDDDAITFNALRMSNGAKVIGKIDSLGNVTIIDEILNTEVISLERIK